MDVGPSTGDIMQVNSREAKKLAILRCIQTLVHACQCRDVDCNLRSCKTMQRVVKHTKVCKRIIKGDCPICKQFMTLCCYHGKRCQETTCSVPLCSPIKRRFRRLHLQQILQQQQLLRRRMDATKRRARA